MNKILTKHNVVYGLALIISILAIIILFTNKLSKNVLVDEPVVNKYEQNRQNWENKRDILEDFDNGTSSKKVYTETDKEKILNNF